MQCQIIGDDVQIALVELSSGEFIQAEAGSMFFIEGNVDIDSRVPGGWVGGLKRMFVGESFVMPIFKAKDTSAKVAFSPPYFGKIVELNIAPSTSWQAQKNGFLFAYGNVAINISFIRKIGVGFFGGEGFILQKYTGSGKVYVHCGGLAVEKVLSDGETIQLDTGCVVAFEESVTYDIKRIKSLKTVFFGGEGLFLTTLTGPGKVILQSMPWSRLRQVLFTGASRSGILGDAGRMLGGD